MSEPKMSFLSSIHAERVRYEAALNTEATVVVMSKSTRAATARECTIFVGGQIEAPTHLDLIEDMRIVIDDAMPFGAFAVAGQVKP